MNLEEVTPENSVVPIFINPVPTEPIDPPAFQHKAKEAGKAKLMALGLTEKEAQAVIGN
jgi:hypothetical protein